MGRVGNDAKVQTNYNNAPRESPVVAQPLRQEYAASLKAVSSDELFAAMKGRPKPDIKIFGPIRIAQSSEYKQVVGKLDEFRNKFAALADNGIGTLNWTSVSDLKETLKEAYAAASSYQDAHASDKKKAPRREAMENLKTALGTEMRTLEKLLENQDNFKPGTTIGDAFAILKSGVNSAAIIDNPHKNKTLVNHQVFGHGQINTVSIASFQKSDNTIEQRVLKPLSREIEKFGNWDDEIGLDPKNAKVGERNLATAGVANLLGLGNMVPKPSVTVFEGQVCLDMPLAKGEGGQKLVTMPIRPGTMHMLKSARESPLQWPEDSPNRAIKLANLEKFIKTYGIESIGIDKNGEEILVEKMVSQLELPFSSSEPNELTANLQKSLMDMQVLDVLTGQVDRHMGNVFIQVSGNEVTMTAIDNDASFGENEAHFVNTLQNVRRDFENWNGLPPVMTQRTAAFVKALEPDTLRAVLREAGLEAKEIGLTLGRLTVLKEHVGNLENQGLVTDDFLNFRTKEPGTDNYWTMSDLLNNTTQGQKTTNYVFKATGMQEQTMGKAIPLAPLDLQKHHVAGN